MGGTDEEGGPIVFANGNSAHSNNGASALVQQQQERVGPHRLIHQLEYVEQAEKSRHHADSQR